MMRIAWSSCLLVAAACDQVARKVLVPATSAFRGPAVTAVGDWDGDGAEDLAIGDWERHRVEVVSGVDGRSLRSIREGGDFGWALAALRREGHASAVLAVSDPKRSTISLYAPESTEPLRVLSFPDPLVGYALASFPDQGSDGVDDLAVGVMERSPDGKAGPGSCVVVSSESGEVATRVRGPRKRSGSTATRRKPWIGQVVEHCPDVDGDGDADLLIGAGSFPQVFLHSGRTGRRLGRWESLGIGGPSVYPIRTGHLDEHGAIVAYSNSADRTGLAVVTTLDGKELHRFEGTGTAHRFGCSISLLHDSESGASELLVIGAPGHIRAGGLPMLPIAGAVESTETGYVQAFSLRTGDVVWERSSSERGDWFGIASSALADVDGDGLDEVAVLASPDDGDRVRLTILDGATGAVRVRRDVMR